MDKATCQVCGRQIKAGTGLIAHHGYTRPYQYFQTSSCAGARYVPYEVSCERLKEVFEDVKGMLVRVEQDFDIFTNTPPATITVSIRRGSWSGTQEETYERPEDFKKNSYRSNMPQTYENAYSDQQYKYEQTIKAIKFDLETMERRINAWEPMAQEV